MTTQLKQALRAFYPWLVIFFCSLFLFYKYILQVSPSVMTNELMRSFHIHALGLGNLAATFFYSYLIVQLFAGPLLDRYSARLLMTLAILICAMGTIIFSLSDALWIAAMGRMMVGIGAAFATVGYMKMAAVYFPPHRFAFVGGLLATAAMIGAVLGEAPMAYLVGKFGWQPSLFYVAIAGVILSILFYLIVRDQTDFGFLPSSNADVLRLEKKDFIAVLKKKRNWILALYSGLAFAPVSVFGGLWGNPFLQGVYHTSKIQTANYISLVFVGLAVGGPLLGYLSDRLSNRLGVMFLGSLMALIALTTVIYVPLSHVMLSLLLFSFGFGTGAFMLGFAMGKEINPPLLAATIVALINTGDAIFGAVTEPLVGKLLDLLWTGKMVNNVPYYSVTSYREALSMLVVYLVLTLFLVLWLKEHNKR